MQLANIVLNGSQEDIQRAALDKITDRTQLARLTKESKKLGTRFAAMNRLVRGAFG